MEKPATTEITIPTFVEFKILLLKASHQADHHNRMAGLYLKELKARVSEPWPEYVRETFGIAHERADELIRLSDRRTTAVKARTIGVAAIKAGQPEGGA
jgi:hypothetical protein